MIKFRPIHLVVAASLVLFSCSSEDPVQREDSLSSPVQEDLIVCNEGNWQSDNGQLSYLNGSTLELTNEWFRKVNGYKLGDTPNDIIQLNDTLIAISVNWSNIIQFIRPDGTAVTAIEKIPNNRRMCTDGKNLYVTSYAHVLNDTVKFTKGYVAKVDLSTFKVIDYAEVGWEPEAIRYYNGKLYVVNTGGYSFSENHDYETTVQVLSSKTMKTLKVIDTGKINLYGEVSQAGKFLCINSCGDYYNVQPATVILDCESYGFYTYDFPSTYNTTDGQYFYTVGSAFSYLTGQYVYSVNTIDPTTREVTPQIYSQEVTEKLKELQSPYEIYCSPYTKNLYFTDAKSYATAGYLYAYDRLGRKLFEPKKVYINPAHLLAIKK